MFATAEELERQLDYIRKSPKTQGTVELIVCRPSVGERKVLESCELNTIDGLEGDNWKLRGLKKSPPKSANPDMQLNLMNARAIEIIAADKSLWQLAGDQFFVDLNLSQENTPPGTQLQIGTAIIQVTQEPHLGCKKFMDRFGKDAVMFVNSDEGKKLNLRGVNAKVIAAGQVARGDTVKIIMRKN